MNRKVRPSIKGKTFLITGGTGSFGTTVVDKLLVLKPKKIIIFSRDEKKQFDMRNKYDNPILQFVIGDVRDRDSIAKATMGVDYVFHAAALKQVPTCEFFPIEAIKTNILGAYNVMEATRENAVKKIVILSTDKATYPINVMGMTKALMEKTMVSITRNLNGYNYVNTNVCGVRYGNVLYSRGSVLPFFIEKLKQGEILPVTNLEMTRCLLPLSRAVDLVLYALLHGKNGYLYVRKASACTIGTLADAVCRIFSYKKGYREVGIRVGEKMHETLVTQEEMLRAIDLGDYYAIPPESQGLEYNHYFSIGKRVTLPKIDCYTSENTHRLNLEETVRLLMSLPEIKKELKNYQLQKHVQE